jgi:D-arabinose 1-dehydrogenase-like Zn-dependent alcohol dehydrogenase
MTGTYNSYERGTKIPTYGGYSTSITADEEYTLHISDKLELSGVVLCYVLESPLFSITSFKRR